uniref:Sushi domain-containing protein n=1 Tax=Tetradesmus obliquus TaxID=3088 RepID=A0A383W151_TETOB
MPQWAKTDNRCVKLAPVPCLGTPPFSLGRQAVWEKDCNGTLAGSKCFARCSGPYEGGGFSSTCSTNGTWLQPTPDHIDTGFDGCSAHTPTCGPPPDYEVPGAAWEDDCVDLASPLACNAPCVAPYTGEGYFAVCYGYWGELWGKGCAKP